MRNIVLIGMPGAGKTTVGKALARSLNLTFVDSDKELVARTGVSVATIFEIEGEQGFRARESALLAELMQRPGLVLATGGGAVLQAENRETLHNGGTVVYLRATLDALWERTRRDTGRPLLRTPDPRKTLSDLLAIRDPLYRETAHVVFDTGRQSASKLAQQIAASLNVNDTESQQNDEHPHS
jgi:shikimate kinase